MTGIQRIITKKKETTLHIAAAANQEKFVRNLLRTMIYNNPYENLTAVNEIGNTALTYAAATGNVNIAMAMLEINSDLPNLHSGVKPLCMAASLGHRKMVQLLYSRTKEVVREWKEDEQDDLFITCIEGDLYGIQRIITKKKETTLHIAAAANQEKFVRNLLRTMIYNNPYENLTAVNEIGNTALTYAAATGNVNIAMAMLEINSDLPNLHSGVKPLCMAASLGHRKMVQLLYSRTKEVVREWKEDEQDDLFITCIEGDLYGVALEMLEDNPNLATARNKDGETVLQLLACNPSAFVGETQPCELLLLFFSCELFD
ncbi:ankyrin repeat domain-containing protein 17 [Quercus suber]|uniref:Ankyrin repeat domain-containing protein 17 n=1 Tax=Quercus suber TaxID=58331 RepID=A0AAW0K4G6_QUESU